VHSEPTDPSLRFGCVIYFISRDLPMRLSCEWTVLAENRWPHSGRKLTEQHWRKVNAPRLVALVRAGVKFPNGQAEMFSSGPSDEPLFAPNPSVYAAVDVPIHNIRQHLSNLVCYTIVNMS